MARSAWLAVGIGAVGYSADRLGVVGLGAVGLCTLASAICA
jgi:hypothetical protein